MKSEKKPSKPDHKALRAAALRRFRIIFGSVRKHFREIERISGITGSQLWILHEISKSNGIGVSDLAERLAIHQSTCSLLIDKLVRSGRVKRHRSADDQRRVELGLTKKGLLTIDRAPGPAEGILPEALSELSTPELRRLLVSLDDVIAGLDLKDELAGDHPLADL